MLSKLQQLSRFSAMTRRMSPLLIELNSGIHGTSSRPSPHPDPSPQPPVTSTGEDGKLLTAAQQLVTSPGAYSVFQLNKPAVSTSDEAAVETDSSRLIISRMTVAAEAQAYSSVHGGIIFKHMEEGGAIFSAQYCQSFSPDTAHDITTVTGWLQESRFIQTMLVGEVAEVYCKVGYTSQHAMQVIIKLMAYSISDGTRRLVNRSKIWFVPMSRSTRAILTVPPFTGYPSEAAELAGRNSYLLMKKEIEKQKDRYSKGVTSKSLATCWSPSKKHRFCVQYSRATHILPVLESSCWPGEQYCRGGELIKLIDDTAGLCSIRHAKYYCITVASDSIVFLKRVNLGSILVSRGEVVFTSKRSVEVKVTVDAQKLVLGEGYVTERVADAIFTFSPMHNFQPHECPPLELQTEEEAKIFEERKQIYERRKKMATQEQNKS